MFVLMLLPGLLLNVRMSLADAAWLFLEWIGRANCKYDGCTWECKRGRQCRSERKHQFHCLGGNIRSSWSRVRAVDSKQATEIRDPVWLHVGTI